MNKKILYIHQYFITPNEPGGTRSYWFSQELLKRGFQVTMITSRNNQSKLVERMVIDGIQVVYINNSYSNHFGILRRLYSFVRFMFLSTWVALFEKKVDLVYATSTPLTIGIPALMLKWFKRKPFVFEVRDLWPEVPIQMGAIRNKIFIWLLNSFEQVIYKNAIHIVALSPGMKEGVLKKGIDDHKVTMIPNMSKPDEFFLRPPNRAMMERFQLQQDCFYAIHFGAMGLANGLMYLIDAFNILKTRGYHKVFLIFAGSGKIESELKSKCHELEINNVLFLGNFPMNEISELVNIADCSIVSFMNLPILETNSPNKLFDSLSAQKPIIVNSAGWTKDMVEQNNCGAFVHPQRPEELADLLVNWSENTSVLRQMGINARKLSEEQFDKKILCKLYGDLISRNV